MQVNILEAKNRLSELVRAAQAGEEVIIANRGKAILRLVPITDTDVTQQDAGTGGAITSWLRTRPRRQPMRTAAEIEAGIAALREDWD
jgi:prevent-host-death family protein